MMKSWGDVSDPSSVVSCATRARSSVDLSGLQGGVFIKVKKTRALTVVAMQCHQSRTLDLVCPDLTACLSRVMWQPHMLLSQLRVHVSGLPLHHLIKYFSRAVCCPSFSSELPIPHFPVSREPTRTPTPPTESVTGGARVLTAPTRLRPG